MQSGSRDSMVWNLLVLVATIGFILSIAASSWVFYEWLTTNPDTQDDGSDRVVLVTSLVE